jgi:hypothetical protein
MTELYFHDMGMTNAERTDVPLEVHLIPCDIQHVRHELELAGWFKLVGSGKYYIIDNAVMFTSSEVATNFFDQMKECKWQWMDGKLWPDADDFNAAVGDGQGVNIAGNIPFANEMLNYDNEKILDKIYNLWMHIYMTCGDRVWYYDNRFWFESKPDMMLVSMFLNEVDIETWKKDSEKPLVNVLRDEDIQDWLKKNGPYQPHQTRPIWITEPRYGNPGEWNYGTGTIPVTSTLGIPHNTCDSTSGVTSLSAADVKSNIVNALRNELKEEEELV